MTSPKICSDSISDQAPKTADSTASDARLALLEKQVEQLIAENRQLKKQWKEATSSISWRVITKLGKIGKKLAPKGSIRRTLIKSVWRGLMFMKRQGPLAWARRLASKIKAKLVDLGLDTVARTRPFLADNRPVIMAISHVGGGGTERHVRDMAARLLNEGVRTIYTRPDTHGRLVFEERDADWKVRWRRTIRPDADQIKNQIAKLQPSLAHIHHTMGVPEALFEHLQMQSVPTDWTLHDYHAICPRIHLHHESGDYCGEPDANACNSCLKRLGDYHNKPVGESIEQYRVNWAARLATARRIYVPSDDAKSRLDRYFPQLQIETRPHMEPSRPDRPLVRRHTPGDRVRVAVIGTIGSIKGSSQLLAAARDAQERDLPVEFVLIGTSNLEPQLLATGRVELTGPYFENEIWDRLDEAECHLAWLPSIWPETYMYTLSVAQLAGFWPVVYDIGAQGRRVSESGVGDCISIDMPPDQLNSLFIEQAERLSDSTSTGSNPPEYAEYPNFLESYYGLTLNDLKSNLNVISSTTVIASENCNTKPESHSSASNLIQISIPHASRNDHARLHQHHSQLSA